VRLRAGKVFTCIVCAGVALACSLPAQAARSFIKPIIKYEDRNWRVMYETTRDKRLTATYVRLLLDCLEECMDPDSDLKRVRQFFDAANEYFAAMKGSLAPITREGGKIKPPSAEVLELVGYLRERRLITREQAFELRGIFTNGFKVPDNPKGKAEFDGTRMATFREFVEGQFEVLLAQTYVPDIVLVFYEELGRRKDDRIRIKLLIILERGLSWRGGRKGRTVASYLQGKTSRKPRDSLSASAVSLEPIDTIMGLKLIDAKNKAVSYWAVRLMALFDSKKMWKLADEIIANRLEESYLISALAKGLVNNSNPPAAAAKMARLMDALYKKSTAKAIKSASARAKWIAEICVVAAAMRDMAPRLMPAKSVEDLERDYKVFFDSPTVNLLRLSGGRRGPLSVGAARNVFRRTGMCVSVKMRRLLWAALIATVACGRTGPPPPPEKPGSPATRPVSSRPSHPALKTLADYKPVVGVHGGSLSIATLSNPKSFNPIIAKETSTTVVTGYMYQALTRANGFTLQPEPELAERWGISKDGLAYTFHLRKGLEWSDGKPITADDVVFTFKLIFDKSIPNSSADIMTVGGRREGVVVEADRVIVKLHTGKQIVVEKLGALSVRFRLPVRFAPFLTVMGSNPIMPRHYLEQAWKAGAFNRALSVKTPPAEMVCSGPFKLASYREGERIILKRNPRYWRRDASGKRLPYLDGITLVVCDMKRMPFKFRAGEIDVLSVRGSDYPALKPLEQQLNFTIINFGPAQGSSFMVFNMNPGREKKTGKPFVEPHKLKWFNNRDFRRAAAYAINKGPIIESVMNGFGYEQWGPMQSSEGYFFNPDVREYEYNPAKARELLAKAGFKDRDGDGVLEDGDGRPVKFTLFTNAGNDVRHKICLLIQDDLRRLGMDVTYTPLEFNVLVDKLENPPHDWEAILLGLTGGAEPHLGQNVWKSSGQLHEWNPKQPKPATEWEAEIDRLFEAGVQEMNPAERKKIYDRWQQIVADELPVIYTVSAASMSAIRNRFGNFFPNPVGGAFHNIDEIFIKE